jgi:hypothetical protein
VPKADFVAIPVRAESRHFSTPSDGFIGAGVNLIAVGKQFDDDRRNRRTALPEAGFGLWRTTRIVTRSTSLWVSHKSILTVRSRAPTVSEHASLGVR